MSTTSPTDGARPLTPEERRRALGFHVAAVHKLSELEERVEAGEPVPLLLLVAAARVVLESAMPWPEYLAALSELGVEAVPEEGHFVSFMEEARGWAYPVLHNPTVPGTEN